MTENLKAPRHIAFIMDGNGRWAKENGLPRSAGHRQGAKQVKVIVAAAAKLGVEVVTFFAFSTENWSRPRNEVALLMRYLREFLHKEIAQLDKNNMRFMVIGRADPVPISLQQEIKKAQERTKHNTGLKVILALNYGGRQEIVDAAKSFARDVLSGAAQVDKLDTEDFSRYLYTAGIVEPDLLVRTSGQLRMSNFLLWQLSYAEFYFTDTCWPDFGEEELKKAVRQFQKRERKFGGLNAH
jgi:undecaprenyl diphosphate synthase